MYVDRELYLSNGQAVTAAAASTHIIDLAAVRREVGVGTPIYLVVSCIVAMTDSSSDSTLAVILQSEAVEAFSSPTTRQTVGTFPAVSAAGTRFVVPLILDSITDRYIRLYYTPADGNLSAGSFDAFLTLNPDMQRVYPDGFTIS